MDKIFHVFISSTYSDLIEERKKVSEAVAKAGFVAEGMEIFPASSQKQLNFIERVIDRCDYYILVIAGRYGSLSEDGISYTEKEFLYAKEKHIPVLAFIRIDTNKLPESKIDQEPLNQAKLFEFVERLKNESLVDFWLNPDELATKALAALSQARVTHEAAGWIRGNTAASTAILAEINELRKENSQLKADLAATRPNAIFANVKVAGLDEKIEVNFNYNWGSRGSQKKSVFLTLRTILAAIGPNFRTPHNSSGIAHSLDKVIKKESDFGDHVSITLFNEDKQRILMQMEALGLMTASVYNLKNGGQGVFHKLTNTGLGEMLKENVFKSEGS